MNKNIFKSVFILLALASLSLFSQSEKDLKQEIKKFQRELNENYLDPANSPLRGENFRNFKKHPFFPINLKYRVKAKFVINENPETVDFPTSAGKVQKYVAFGKAFFDIDGQTQTLTIYQSLNLRDKDEYKDYLFLPFRDATNGKETYGGGKYMDLKIPNSNEIILDFNQSYQPYCAYNALDYSCPIVLEENKLPIEIKAGVKYKAVYY